MYMILRLVILKTALSQALLLKTFQMIGSVRFVVLTKSYLRRKNRIQQREESKR